MRSEHTCGGGSSDCPACIRQGRVKALLAVAEWCAESGRQSATIADVARGQRDWDVEERLDSRAAAFRESEAHCRAEAAKLAAEKEE
jgi:hypothetical protein